MVKSTDIFPLSQIETSFWSYVFNKPGLAKYYLEDWDNYWLKHNQEETSKSYFTANIFMAYVEEDYPAVMHYSHRAEQDDKLCFISQCLFVHASSILGGPELAEHSLPVLTDQSDILDVVVYTYLTAQLKYLSGLHQESETIVNVLLENRGFRAPYSGIFQYFLGLIYIQKLEISILNDDSMVTDHWMKKLRKKIQQDSLAVLGIRYQYLSLKFHIAKKSRKELDKYWKPKEAEKFGSISDEILLGLWSLDFMKNEGQINVLEAYYSKWKEKFEFVFLGDLLQVLLGKSGSKIRLIENKHLPAFLDKLDQSSLFFLFGETYEPFNKTLKILQYRIALVDRFDYDMAFEPINDLLISHDFEATLRFVDLLGLDNSDLNDALIKTLHRLNLATKRQRLNLSEVTETINLLSDLSNEILFVKNKQTGLERMLDGKILLVCWEVFCALFKIEGIQKVLNTNLHINAQVLDIEVDFNLEDNKGEVRQDHIDQISQLFDALMIKLSSSFFMKSIDLEESSMINLEDDKVLKWHLSIKSNALM